MAQTRDVQSLEYLLKLQTEICNAAKPLDNELLIYLIEMACIEMADMLARIRIDEGEASRLAVIG